MVASKRYNLRSRDTAAQPVTPSSPATPRRLTFSAEASPATSSLSSEEQSLADAPDIFNRPICRCPRPCTRGPFEKSLCDAYFGVYGSQNWSYLRQQENEEHQLSEAVSQSYYKKLNEKRIELRTSPQDEDLTSSVGDDDSPVTPAPGKIIRFRLNNFKADNKGVKESTDALHGQPHLFPNMRAILVSWMVEVTSEYKLSQATYHLGVTILDHVLLVGAGGRRGVDQLHEIYPANFQALGWYVRRTEARNVFAGHDTHSVVSNSACLWIAAKVEERDPMTRNDLCYIADFAFSSEDLLDLERTICRLLKFCVSRVTPFHYAETMLLACDSTCGQCSGQFERPILRNMLHYLMALGRINYELSFEKPGLRAAAAMYLARATLNIRDEGREDYWSESLEHYTGYKKADLMDSVILLHRYHSVAEHSEQKAAYTLFQKSEYSRVSLRTVRPPEEIGFAKREAF